MKSKSEKLIAEKIAAADKTVLLEKANNLTKWADAVDSGEYKHTNGTFHAGNDTSQGGGSRPNGFTKGGGGKTWKHRCVWGALADMRVNEGVGSWSYGGYSDDEQIGQNMPSRQLADFVGLTEGDVVADITRQYMEQHVPDYAMHSHDVPHAFVHYNDRHSSYGKLSQVMRDTAADIKRRVAEAEAAS